MKASGAWILRLFGWLILALLLASCQFSPSVTEGGDPTSAETKAAPVTTVEGPFVTTAPITTVPVTTAPVTTVPITTAPVTTGPADVPGGDTEDDTGSLLERYFDFDNVRIEGYFHHTLITYDESGDIDRQEFSEVRETLKLDGERWWYHGALTAYFDGETVHILDAEVDEDAWANENERFLSNIRLLVLFEDSFVETEAGLYEAAQIGRLTNAKIAVFQGELQYIQYAYTEENLPEADLCETLVTFFFWDFGSTEIEPLS